MMTSDKLPRSARRAVSIGSIEVALVVSLVALAIGIALARFAGLATSTIVIGTIVGATVVGFLQPAARLQPIPVRPSRRSRR